MQKEVSFSEARSVQYPKGVFIVIARDAAGKCNPVSVGSLMYASAEPHMFAVALSPTHHTTGAIRHSREFVIAIPSENQAEETMLYGTRSGRDTDKLVLAHAKTEPAHRIDCVLLSDAVANYECRLVSETEMGDHIVFGGEVVCSHVNEKPLRPLYVVGPGHKLGGVG